MQKRLGLVGLSIFVGISALFIPHLIYWFTHRKIAPIDPNQPHSPQGATPGKSHEVGLRVIPKKPIRGSSSTETQKAPSKGSTNQSYGGNWSKTPATLSGKVEPPTIDSLLATSKEALLEQTSDSMPILGETGVVNNRLLFHLHAHKFGAHSSLKGAPASLVLDFMNDYLKKRIPLMAPSVRPLYSELQKKIEQAAQISTSHHFVGDMQGYLVNCMSTRDPLLIPGGWAGKSGGHTMYYEIIPESASHCTFRLYNLGAGSQNHPKMEAKSGAFIDWKGVELTRLTNPHFLQALQELKTHITYPGQESLTEYQENDVYCGLKNLLQPTHVEWKKMNQTLPNMMQTHEIGICSWKSLAAVFNTYLPADEYKRFMCDLKIQSVCQFAKQYEHQPIGPIDAQLLKNRSDLLQTISRSKSG